MQIQPTLNIPKTEISKYPLKSENIDLTLFPFSFYTLSPGIPNYWYLKVNFLGPENLLWDIGSLVWNSTLRHRELTVFIKVNIQGTHSCYCFASFLNWRLWRANINIGIKHGFTCINVCQVPREMLKTRGRRPRFSTTPEGPDKR